MTNDNTIQSIHRATVSINIPPKNADLIALGHVIVTKLTNKPAAPAAPGLPADDRHARGPDVRGQAGAAFRHGEGHRPRRRTAVFRVPLHGSPGGREGRVGRAPLRAPCRWRPPTGADRNAIRSP